MSVMCAHQLHNIQHRSHFVWEKNGELLHQWPVQLRIRLRQISSHLNGCGAPQADAGASANYLIVGVLLANVICWFAALNTLSNTSRITVAERVSARRFAVRIW